MNIETIIEYTAKASVRTLVYVYDDDDKLVEPTSVLITLVDADGVTKIDGEDIVVSGKIEDGIYEHFYNTSESSAKGWWQGTAEVIDGTAPTDRTSIANYSFRIK
ncbi:unnamed protein product [marine sediment metagenome]|uniref:Uncharacterized protein n=1 Tax=marine sediment metagenome TaxID=412755 RepID=X0SUX7_9ZZZZ